MFIEEGTTLDSENKNRKIYFLSCDFCRKKFSRYSRFSKKKGGHLCSPLCTSLYKGTKKRVKCSNCNKNFIKSVCKLKNSKSGLSFCSRECKDKAQSYDDRIKPSHYGKIRKNYRKIAFKNKEIKCERCGYDECELALDVHHKDKDRKNNKINNLEILCCNCHAIEHRSKI